MVRLAEKPPSEPISFAITATSAHLPVFSSTSVPPEAGCSITSAATVSTAGPTGKRPFRATFFAGARLGLARFAGPDFATLRGLPRLAEFPLRSLARFGSFDCFLRLAMIDPAGWCFP
jgi:hypothetical protein